MNTTDAVVYIVECADGSFYTGATKNLEKRIQVHNEGKGAKYTRARLPVRLVYSEILEDYNAALRREKALQKLSRREKKSLIEQKMSLNSVSDLAIE